MDEPTDPITELAAGALQVHEVYMAYVEAGFTEAQALSLVKTIISAGITGSAT